MNRLIDNIITLRILHILLQPIENSDAFRLGIIDKNGKQIRIPSTEDEKDSFTILNKLAFKIKNIINHNVKGENDLRAFATGVHAVKEGILRDKEVEYVYSTSYHTISENEINRISGLILQEDAPVNSASASPGVAGFTPDTLGVKKKPKVLKRKTLKNFI